MNYPYHNLDHIHVYSFNENKILPFDFFFDLLFNMSVFLYYVYVECKNCDWINTNLSNIKKKKKKKNTYVVRKEGRA